MNGFIELIRASIRPLVTIMAWAMFGSYIYTYKELPPNEFVVLVGMITAFWFGSRVK